MTLVDVLHVFDTEENAIISLEYYTQLKNLSQQDHQVINSVLKVLSMRNYRSFVHQIQGSFGLSSCSFTRSFIVRSKEALEGFEARKFTSEEFVTIFLDGNYLTKQEMVIA